MGSLNCVGGPTAKSANGSMAIAMPDGVTPSISVNGSDYTPLAAGGFGANTTVQLPNNLAVNVNALNVQTSLTNNTSGSEASQWVIRLLKGGAGAPGGGFGVDTITLAPDQITLNSLTATLSLFSDTTISRDAAFGNIDLIAQSGSGDVSFGTHSAMSTSATSGFVDIPSCAGTPTGVPTRRFAGKICMVYDTSANKIWFNNGGTWRGVVVA